MNKRVFSFFLAVILVIGLVQPAFAASDRAMEAAGTLYDLGLFRGVGKLPDGSPDFALDQEPTRAQAVTMLVRLIGREDQAVSGNWTVPFTDVPNWALPYVGYAYAHDLTRGMSANTFGSELPVSAAQYITFVLRALGYSSDGDFRWNRSWEMSDELGITSGEYGAGTAFTRGDVAIISNNTLSARLKGRDFTLLQFLNGDVSGDNAGGATGENPGASSGKVEALSLSVFRETGQVNISRPSQKPGGRMGESGLWTIFVYLCGSDLESRYGLASGDLQEMIGSSGGGVRFVVQTGGSNSWSRSLVSAYTCQRFLVQDGGISQVDQQAMVNMGDGESLRDFLQWGVNHYASEHMGVILWDHGGGSIGGVCYDERYSYDSLSLRELDEAFLPVFREMTQKFDFIGFDACLMATVETANILASYADYMFASEETEPGTGWDFVSVGKALAADPSMTAPQLGKVVCDSYMESIRRIYDNGANTMSVIDLSKVDDFIKKFNVFSKNMYSAGEDVDKLSQMVRGVKTVESFGGNSASEGYSNMVDAAGFIRAVAPYAAGADEVLDALSEVVIYSVNGIKHQTAGGLSMYYPISFQGAKELTLFSEICFSPFYLSFVDRLTYANAHSGDSNGYDDGFWYDHGEIWHWASSEEEYSETQELNDYWDYVDDLEPAGSSSAITFSEYPHLDQNGGFTFTLDEHGLDRTKHVYGYLQQYSLDGEALIELGQTFNVKANWSTGTFSDRFSGKWMSLPDRQCLALYFVAAEAESVVFTSPIYLNGEKTNLRLRQYQDGRIEVEGAWGGISANGAAARDIVQIQEGDVIAPRYVAYSLEDNSQIGYRGYDFIVGGALDITYDVLISGDYRYCFCIDDIYGDYYRTGYVTYKVDEHGSVFYLTD